MMRKYLALILIILTMLFVAACGSSEQENTENSSMPTPEELGLRPTNTNYTRDFDEATNQTIIFGDIMFQIPKKWTTVESTDMLLQINGISESQAGPMWLELLDSEMTEDDLASFDCQQAILRSYTEMMKESFDNVKVTNSTYNENSQLYFANIEASKYNIHAEWGICAFVEWGNLYVYLVPFMDGDEYDYSLDVQEVVRSIDTIDQTDDTFAWDKGGLSDSEIFLSPEQNQGFTENEINISTADISDIAVRFETDYIDGDRLHITVFTKNNSAEMFVGNVYVVFYSADEKDRLGSDTIIVDELLPGHESWADIIVDAYRGTPKMVVDFYGVSFIPIKEVVAEIDSDATEKTKSSYYWSFYDVSWYKDITDIVVYKNRTCVVVLKDNPKEGGQFYAATIWGCGNAHGVETVQVVDKNGTIVSVYGNGDMISVTVNNGIIAFDNTQDTETTDVSSLSCSHSWNNGETTQTATCTETGMKIYTCTKCFAEKIESISIVNHIYDAGSVSKNPTCTEVGRITYTCVVCKKQYSEDVAPLPHTWNSGTITKNPTCTVEGIRAYNCTSCNASTTESIPTVAHSFTNQLEKERYLHAEATFDSGTVYYCSCVCGATGNVTFTSDDRIEWISISRLECSDFNCSFVFVNGDAAAIPYYWIKNNDSGTVFNIYDVPSGALVDGEIYTGNCDGYSIRFKSEEAPNPFSTRDYFYFYYDDLVAAGIFE